MAVKSMLGNLGESRGWRYRNPSSKTFGTLSRCKFAEFGQWLSRDSLCQGKEFLRVCLSLHWSDYQRSQWRCPTLNWKWKKYYFAALLLFGWTLFLCQLQKSTIWAVTSRTHYSKNSHLLAFFHTPTSPRRHHAGPNKSYWNSGYRSKTCSRQ